MINGFIQLDKLGDGYYQRYSWRPYSKKYRTSIFRSSREGGTSPQKQLAMIGEGSEPEAVIPLSKLEPVLEELYEREELAHHLAASNKPNRQPDKRHRR